MWHTPLRGGTPLSGNFKKLVLGAAIDEIEFLLDVCEPYDGKPPSAGRSFDSLSEREQAYALAVVAKCLTTNCQEPELLQWNESTAAAIFLLIYQSVRLELEDSDMGNRCCDWRALVAGAERELVEDDGLYEYVNPESENIEDWSQAIETLESHVLWDADHTQQCADAFLKKSASEATVAGLAFGISNAYYTTTIPEVTDERLKEVEDFLNSADVSEVLQ